MLVKPGVGKLRLVCKILGPRRLSRPTRLARPSVRAGLAWYASWLCLACMLVRPCKLAKSRSKFGPSRIDRPTRIARYSVLVRPSILVGLA